jgi:septal ring factor EnvC (AmiA/AmiB activator)
MVLNNDVWFHIGVEHIKVVVTCTCGALPQQAPTASEMSGSQRCLEESQLTTTQPQGHVPELLAIGSEDVKAVRSELLALTAYTSSLQSAFDQQKSAIADLTACMSQFQEAYEAQKAKFKELKKTAAHLESSCARLKADKLLLQVPAQYSCTGVLPNTSAPKLLPLLLNTL